MSNKKFISLLGATLLVSSTCLTSLYAMQPKVPNNNPIALNFMLDQVEDALEKNSDKQYDVDWDFEIIYVDGKVMVLIEYDADDAKKFKAIEKAEIEKLLTTISQEILKALKQDLEINGVIVPDDSTKPVLTFMYKNNKLELK